MSEDNKQPKEEALNLQEKRKVNNDNQDSADQENSVRRQDSINTRKFPKNWKDAKKDTSMNVQNSSSLTIIDRPQKKIEIYVSSTYKNEK